MQNNSGVGFTDAGVLALLADTARAGRGGGYWGGEGYGPGGYGPFSSPSSTAVRLERNAKATEDEADCTRQLFGQAFSSIRDAFENQTRSGQFNDLCQRISQNDVRVTDNQFRAELRNSDRIAALQQMVNDFRAEAAKCCCDNRLELCQVESRLSAKMEALSKESVLRDLNRAERQLQTQTIISTCGCGCQGGVRPCPPHPHPHPH